MGMKRSLFFVGCLTGILLGVLITLTLRHPLRSVSAAKVDRFGAASEWKSFSIDERTVYVRGYTAGYNIGGSDACDNAAQLFETKGQVLANGTLASQVELCDAARDHFTRMGDGGKLRANFSVYSDVNTEFYNKYPKYNNVPFSFLMTLLADKKFKTADELFSKLERHDLQTTF
jgi:hypothetical protein